MPDQRRHRGAHPEDGQLFAPPALPALRGAVADLSWLLSRDYALPSALKLVGDRYNLTQRQRMAIMRSACSDSALADRQRRRVDLEAVRNQRLLIDGYNLLTTLEAALGGGVILLGRDGCYRDMASIHGTYRKVEETLPALTLAGETMGAWRTGPCTWYLDSPVSNSGRLKAMILEVAQEQGWDWQVEVVIDPDPVLAGAAEIVATADSVILDRCGRWFNLARRIIGERIAAAWVVDLSGAEQCPS